MLHGDRETVDVPAQSIVAGVRVDRSEDASGGSRGDLVSEVVAGQGRVVHLDVDADVLGEVVLLQEGVDSGDVVVVLVLGRLEGFRLDEDGSLEADGVLVFDDEVQEASELLELATHVGVEKGLVTLAATPQHVVRSSEPVGRLEHLAHLTGGVGEQLRVGVRGGTGLIPRV